MKISKRNVAYIKDLTQILVIKEIKSKYTSATLGFLWVTINPLIQMIVLSIVFTIFLKIPVSNYPLFVFSGLLPWTFFSQALTSGTSSLISNRDLIKKLPFPRELLPISSVLAHLFTFVLALVPFIFFSIIIFDSFPNIFFLIPLVILQTLLVCSLALLLSSLDIYYRDVSFALQAILVVWFYITPILYPLGLVPAEYSALYFLNPMVGIVTSYQAVFYDGLFFNYQALVISAVVTILFAVLGFFIFRQRAKYFADWV